MGAGGEDLGRQTRLIVDECLDPFLGAGLIREAVSPTTRCSVTTLNASDAARRLGVSAKALRLYEQRGLVTPLRTAAGWRVYGAVEMARLGEIVALRAVGLSLGEVARVLEGDAAVLDAALAAHQSSLESGLDRVRRVRAELASGKADLTLLTRPHALSVAFDLPWPWGGERFELADIKPLTYIVGPLGSGKTRLAMRLAETLPDAVFIGLDRQPLDVERLQATFEAHASKILVIDLLEQGLDQATQENVIAWLRRRAPDAQPVFFLTRSTAILDLEAVGPHEVILFCPANHSVPTLVAPHPGAPGYEAVASCLASPEVRARTEGVIALRPATPSAG